MRPERSPLLHALWIVAACSALGACSPSYYVGTPTNGVDLSRPTFVTTQVPADERGGEYALMVGLTEVTQRQWLDLMGTEVWFNRRCDDCPVEMVSWYDAAAYANALSAREGLSECYTLERCTPGSPDRGRHDSSPGQHELGLVCEAATSLGTSCNGYRLPTPREWEAFAPVAALEAGGSVGDYATFGGYGPGVATRNLPNELGVYDTVGNVGEWLDAPGAPPADEADGHPNWFVLAHSCHRHRRRQVASDIIHIERASQSRSCVGFRLVRSGS